VGGILFFYNHFIPSGLFILRGAPFCGKEKGENSPNQTPKG
jgi:hypothetical protein